MAKSRRNSAALQAVATRYARLAAAFIAEPNPEQARQHAMTAIKAFTDLEAIDPGWLREMRIDLPALCDQHGLQKPRATPPPAKVAAGPMAARLVRLALVEQQLARAFASPPAPGAHVTYALAAAQLQAAAARTDVTQAARDALTALAARGDPGIAKILATHPTNLALTPPEPPAPVTPPSDASPPPHAD